MFQFGVGLVFLFEEGFELEIERVVGQVEDLEFFELENGLGEAGDLVVGKVEEDEVLEVGNLGIEGDDFVIREVEDLEECQGEKILRYDTDAFFLEFELGVLTAFYTMEYN